MRRGGGGLRYGPAPRQEGRREEGKVRKAPGKEGGEQ